MGTFLLGPRGMNYNFLTAQDGQEAPALASPISRRLKSTNGSRQRDPVGSATTGACRGCSIASGDGWRSLHRGQARQQLCAG